MRLHAGHRDTGGDRAHERTGLIVRERNATALAEALARLLDDVALRARLAAAARARVEAEFELGRNAARLRAVAWEGAAAPRSHEPDPYIDRVAGPAR